ncbi:DNA-binding response regulator [Spirochaetia bacterium]|nr:DNA-binding response regulator [Spirochaetia bacterium]
MIRVLIVDDEPNFRDFMLQAVDWNGLGYEIAGTAKNGEEALETALRVKPGLVLLDINMPKMDGIAFSEKIREKSPNVRIVFISGYSEFEYARKAVHLHADDYLLKPVSEEEITEVLKKIAGHEKPQESKRLALLNKSMIQPADGDDPGPGDNKKAALHSRHILDKILNYIGRHYKDYGISAEVISDYLCLDPSYVRRVFARGMKDTISRYITRLRMEEAGRLIFEGQLSITDIAYRLGYNDSGYFAKCFKHHFGVSPRDYP